MAFPEVTTLLDDYNRADQDPLSGGTLGWVSPMGFPGAGFGNTKIVSQQLANSHPTGSGSSVTTTTYGPDVCLVLELPVATLAVGCDIYLWGRVQNAGTDNFSGYAVEYHRFSTGEYEVNVLRDDAGSDVGLDTVFSPSSAILANGDALGLRCLGTTISGFYRTSGTWNQIGVDHTDATYTTAGPIAIHFENGTSTLRADNLSGGTIGGATSRPPQGMIQSLNWVGCGVKRSWHRRRSGIFVPEYAI